MRAAEMLEAILIAPILRPMIAGADMLGEYELDLLAREIAATDGSRFAALVAGAIRPVR